MPLKKVGFQIKKGAIPHFKKIEKTMKNQANPITKISFTAETFIK